MIRDSGRYTPAEVVKDLPGKDRVVKQEGVKTASDGITYR